MRLTIIPGDKAVYKDDVSYLNLSFTLPENIHALQWDGATNYGWVEFKSNSDGTKPNNQIINALPDWVESAMTAWDNADYNEKNPPTPTDDVLIAVCKAQAQEYLQKTDWSEIPSVVDTNSPQYLLNAQEFIDYRIQVRALVINPVPNPVWPTTPTAQWSS
jgi:hypothetical protein